MRFYRMLLFCQNISLMVNIKANISILFFLAIAISLHAQQDGSIKYQGFFPADTQNPVLISLKQVKSKLTGVLKYENKFQTSNLEGYINKEKTFRLFELDAEGNRTGVSMKGTIDGGKMLASYSNRGKTFNFNFLEVAARNPDGSLQHVKRKNDAFAELELNFRTLPEKNVVLQYDDLANTVKIGDSPFLDFTITKVGSYAASFSIRERMQYLQKHSYGRKIKFEDGCTGLVVHAYYYSYEGALFNTYLFVYDEYGDYIQSFVLYEAIKQKGNPNILTRFSASQIFSIIDYSQGVDAPIKFRIDENGDFDFLDRD